MRGVRLVVADNFKLDCKKERNAKIKNNIVRYIVRDGLGLEHYRRCHLEHNSKANDNKT